jgi:hypothetical protein
VSPIERFGALPLLSPDRQDHIDAAEVRNQCRRNGVQIGTIDALLAQLMYSSWPYVAEHGSRPCSRRVLLSAAEAVVAVPLIGECDGFDVPAGSASLRHSPTFARCSKPAVRRRSRPVNQRHH